ncbi:hypothetical protein [Flavitalea sp.]|nr:hypothetical protein [Flavitalea sp.]
MQYRALPAFIILFFLHVDVDVNAQSGYRIGTSIISLEPDSSIFSLALGGYGAPAEGRFTITWDLAGDAPHIKNITGLNGNLYGLNTENELLKGAVSKTHISWQKFGTEKNIIALTGLNGKLFCINNKHELLKGAPAQNKAIWSKIGVSQDNTIAIAGLNEKLYAINEKNELLERNLASDGNWKIIDSINDVSGLTSDGRMLYSVNNDNTIWYLKKVGFGNRWIKIGRYNGFTYKIKVRQLAVVNTSLYALADDGKIYRARHSSDGDISARAMAVQNGKQTVIIVGVDLVSFNYSLITAIKNIVYTKRNIPPQAIFINGSHTHFAPTMKEALTYGEPMQLPDSNYLNNVVKNGIVKAIETALDNLSPSELSFVRGSTNIGHNRSSPDRENPYDHSLDIIKAESSDKKKRSILFLTGCHPVAKNAGFEGYTISANFPGVTKKLLQDKSLFNQAMFIQGCAGDINPRDDDHEKTGTELANNIVSALTGGLKKISGSISFYLDTLQIHISPWSIGQIEKFKQDNSEQQDLESIKNVRWANVMLKRYKEGKVPTTWPVYVQTLNIGNWKLVGLSREAVTEYGMAIKNLWPDKLVSVAGYTNDVPSYLPKSNHILAKTYEGYNSFFWNAQPAIPPLDVFDIVVSQIKKLNR